MRRPFTNQTHPIADHGLWLVPTACVTAALVLAAVTFRATRREKLEY